MVSRPSQSLAPPADPDERRERAQRIRENRLRTGFVSYGLAFVVIVATWAMGFFEGWVVLASLAMIVPINAGLLVIFRTGLNLRFRDRDMTLWQLCLASTPVLFTMYFAGEARGAFVVLALSVTMYGLFSFRTRDFIFLTVFILLGYSVVIALLLAFRPDEFDRRVDTLQWLAVLIAMAQFSSLAGYVNRLRGKVRARNQELAQRNDELEAALARIREMAIRDELTGAYNRRHLAHEFSAERKRVEREGGTLSFALLDVDLFKSVNDTHGHLAGDDVLKGIATVLRRELRETDPFGRWGGEEFAVLLVGASGSAAHETMARVLTAIESERFETEAGVLRVTASVGVTQFVEGEDERQTFARADAALYDAKHAGRNRAVLV